MRLDARAPRHSDSTSWYEPDVLNHGKGILLAFDGNGHPHHHHQVHNLFSKRLALRRHTTPLTLFQATEPLTERSVDIFGPIPASKKGNRFILVITSRFAKLTKCVALRRITAMSVASAIIDAWVCAHRPPDRIL